MNDRSVDAKRANAITRAFIIGIVVALGAAALFPSLGAKGGSLHAEMVSKLGIMLIFLIQGIQLPTEQLSRSLQDWRLHAFIQISTFVLFPLITLLFLLPVDGMIPADLRLGFLYLAILPTTISSAVILVSAAKGDLAAALFNTALSNVLGIVFVPLASAWLISSAASIHVPIMPLLWNVIQLLFLPFACGQMLRPWFKASVVKHRPLLVGLNNAIILFLVYTAFCDSFVNKTWTKHGLTVAAWAGFGALALLLVSTSCVWWAANLFRFPFEGRVTALYCASQKTLAAGVPLAGSVFASATFKGQATPFDLSLILLPLMFYHSLQLTLGGLLLPWLHRKALLLQE